jgi:hypothetical protein
VDICVKGSKPAYDHNCPQAAGAVDMCFRSSVWAGGDVIHERRRATVEWWASWTEQGRELTYAG